MGLAFLISEKVAGQVGRSCRPNGRLAVLMEIPDCTLFAMLCVNYPTIFFEYQIKIIILSFLSGS